MWVLSQVRQFHRVLWDRETELSAVCNRFQTSTSLLQLALTHIFADLISRGWQPPPSIYCPFSALLRAEHGWTTVASMQRGQDL